MGLQPSDSASLFERASASVAEYRKTLTAISSGSLAVFFLALTAKVEPSLTRFQKGALAMALFMMAFSILSVIVSLFADARWAYAAARYARAEETQSTNNDIKSWMEQRDQWHMTKRWSDLSIGLFFLFGAAAASIYIFSRLLNN